MTAGKARPLGARQVLGFVARRWLRQPGRFAAIVLFLLMATLCDLSVPWAAGALMEAVSQADRFVAQAWRACIILSLLYLSSFLLRAQGIRVMIAFTARNMEQLANDAFAHVLAFSSDWHDNNFAGATVRQVSRATQGYDNVTDALLLMLGPSVVVLLGLVISIGLRNPAAGLFCGVLVVAFMVYSLFVTARFVRPLNLKSTELDTEIGATLADTITGNALVRSFGAEARETARFTAVTGLWRSATIRTGNAFNVAGLGQSVMLVALQAGLTALLVLSWSHYKATPGDVAFAITSFMVMSGYLRNFSETARKLQQGLDEVLDVAAYMQTPPQVADRVEAPALVLAVHPPRGGIVFDRVGFRYASQSDYLYNGFSLAIAPGERVALAGPTGSGKSTFIKLIQRLYDLEDGRILIDGIDIAQVAQASLRRAIALVPQDPALFHRSLRENIAYGRPDASFEQIVLAAKRARAHDFIARLDAGYDTLVGERGVKLSGGERQRVAIARALLADSPILVMDEATSSLDVETERQVQAASEALMSGRTTIVIAHRLSTVRGADRILVFDQGRVVEEGTHSELLSREGVYARLHALTH